MNEQNCNLSFSIQNSYPMDHIIYNYLSDYWEHKSFLMFQEFWDKQSSTKPKLYIYIERERETHIHTYAYTYNYNKWLLLYNMV